MGGKRVGTIKKRECGFEMAKEKRVRKCVREQREHRKRVRVRKQREGR